MCIRDRDYCLQVVIGEDGTGHTARPAGYLIGGKTGTAETQPRGNGEYVVSFMGYAPADDPEIAIYVVVDRPNAEKQDDAKFATRIVRSILTEVLPYLDIFMTEPLSEEEQAELEEAQIAYKQELAGQVSGNDVSGNGIDGNGVSQNELPDTGEDGTAAGTGEDASGSNAGDGTGGTSDGEDDENGTDGGESDSGMSMEDMEIDPETGYGVLPDGTKVDPQTGEPIENVELNLPEPNLPLDEEDEGDSPF